ncbi:MAG: DUF4158 domain-containing protein [Candidatus Eremiobacteraeota bacterium]|nr:DUF4158 domain-containing protein [Candidatus Eremiobacteraeota bacterium]
MSPRRSPGPSRTGVNLGDDEIVRDWSLSVEDAAEVMRARGAEHRLRFAVQLCALRATGRFLSDYKQVPIEALGYLAHQLGLTPVLFLTAAERPATETAQAARIREYLGFASSTPRLSKGCAIVYRQQLWRAPRRHNCSALPGTSCDPGGSFSPPRAHSSASSRRWLPPRFRISMNASWRDCLKVSGTRSTTW